MTMRTSHGKWLLPFVIVIGLGMPIALTNGQSTGELERGKALYRGHCAACHGLDGGGNGPRAPGLTPAPTNFLDPNLLNILSDNDLQQAILAGKPGTAMKGYGTVFKHADVAALIKYLRSLSGTS